MKRARARRFSSLFGLGLALAGASACSAGKGSNSGVHGGLGPGGGSGASSGTDNGAIGNIDTSNNNNGADAGCQHIEVNFVPKIPSIFVLVDRSDSMFTPDPTTQVASWDPLKAGVLSVVADLQSQIRFGFGAFSGQQGGMCPVFNSIAPTLNNAKAITDVYQPLGRLTGAKGETPVTEVLPKIQELLTQPGNDGDKYILFVTDGEPDFCDDGNAECPVDAVVGNVQRLAMAGIHTLVFGLKSAQSSISDGTLQAVANAGAGQPVASPFGTDTPQNLCYACSTVAGWNGEWTGLKSAPDCMTAGKQTLGSYAAAGGTAVVYHPNTADQKALTDQIASVVSGIKSCTFDLGGQITVNLDLLSEASVALDGQTVPLSMDNGWHMNTTTQLALVGAACDNWRKPETTKIDFNFPCDLIVPK
ncbi:MAG: VWA domain-containing protein [Pseudomonadota bacterium]